MKKVLVLGGSGRVGSKLIEYAIQENFEVSTILRSPSENLEKFSKLQIFFSDLNHPENLSKAFENKDCIFSCLSGRKTKPDYSILSKGCDAILNFSECKRIIFIGGAGVLEDKEFGLRRNRPNYPEIFKNVSSENLKVLEKLKKSDKDWSFLAAPEMPIGERTKKYRLEKDYLPENGNRISVEDVADAMLKIIDLDWTKKFKIGISY